jgi:hypothetical protein
MADDLKDRVSQRSLSSIIAAMHSIRLGKPPVAAARSQICRR